MSRVLSIVIVVAIISLSGLLLNSLRVFNFNFLTVSALFAIPLVLVKLEIAQFFVAALEGVDALDFDVLK